MKNIIKSNSLRKLSRSAKCQKHCTAAAGVELSAQLEEKESRGEVLRAVCMEIKDLIFAGNFSFHIIVCLLIANKLL